MRVLHSLWFSDRDAEQLSSGHLIFIWGRAEITCETNFFSGIPEKQTFFLKITVLSTIFFFKLLVRNKLFFGKISEASMFFFLPILRPPINIKWPLPYPHMEFLLKLKRQYHFIILMIYYGFLKNFFTNIIILLILKKCCSSKASKI